MRKGSRSRKCYRCGVIVMWWIPDGVDRFGIPQWKTKPLANYAQYKSRYCCKECKRLLENPESFWEDQRK